MANLNILLPLLENDYPVDHLYMENIINDLRVDYLFDEYLDKRLKEDISIERFTNIIKNICIHEPVKLSFNLTEILLDVVSKEYLRGNIKYFQFLSKFGANNYICSELIMRTTYHVSHNYIISKSIEYCKEIANHADVDVCNVLSKLCLQHYSALNKTNVVLLIDALDLRLRYRLMVYSCKNAYPVFFDIINSMTYSAFYSLISNDIRNNKENSKIVCAIRENNMIQYDLNRCKFLMKLLFTENKFLPNTIDYICQQAIMTKNWDFLIEMAEFYDKKKILKAIASSNDIEAIDKFFSTYKHDLAVKIFAPFI